MYSQTGVIIDLHVFHVDCPGTSASIKLNRLYHFVLQINDNSVIIASATTNRHKQVFGSLRKKLKRYNRPPVWCLAFQWKHQKEAN